MELETSVPLAGEKVRVDANITLSRNRISSYTAYYDLYDTAENYEWVGQTTRSIKSTTISFSPDVTGMGSVTYQPLPALYINLLGRYTGKQYLDNTSDESKAIDGYFVSNLSAGYIW